MAAKPGAFFFSTSLPVTLVDKNGWLSIALILKQYSQAKQMRNLASSITNQSRSVGIETVVGQIDLIGASGEILKSWCIRSPRCTIGSGLDCSVQLTSPGVVPLHATLIFGKKHTLLRSNGPTLISNRHVREWLIDHSTEIVVGQIRLVVHPSMGLLATVVHAKRMTDQAARLSKKLTPSISEPKNSIGQNSLVQQPNASENAIESSSDSSASFTALSKLDSIEQLLLSLQVTLDRMQSSIGTDTKNANESIVESVSHGMDEFGKRLFSTLNLQTGAQQSLISNLADRFSDRFGAIDDQLSRFSEATSQQANSLGELLAQASSEQELIEARFQEVICQRNELIGAVQELRNEIAIAFQMPTNTTNLAWFGATSQSIAASDEWISASGAGEPVSDSEPPVITDAQLAESLERAQIQIQELNHQLRTLETERDYSQHRVESLSESLQSIEAAPQLETDAQYLYDAAHYEEPQHEEGYYEEVPVAMEPCDETPLEDVQNEESYSEIRPFSDGSEEDEPGAIYEDTPEQSTYQADSSTPIDSEPPDPSRDKLDSISERLRRMLLDADQRRGTESSLRQLCRDASNENIEEELDGESSLRNVQANRFRDSDEQSEEYANEDSESESRPGADEEDSIEQYMQRLLHRVRGSGDSEIAAEPSSDLDSFPSATSIASSPGTPLSRRAASLGLDSNDVVPLPAVQKLSEELFVPRQQFPKQKNDLAALRELANIKARLATNRSDSRRTNAPFYVKLGITALAVSSAAALFMLNGFALNALFAGTISSIVVSILWGYDCLNHFKRIKKCRQQEPVTKTEVAAGQSILGGAPDNSGWRPTSS